MNVCAGFLLLALAAAVPPATGTRTSPPSHAGSAVPGPLSGRVLDQYTRLAVLGAVVSVADTARAESDSSGRFAVTGLREGPLAVRVTHVAYLPWTQIVEVRPGVPVRLAIQLLPNVRTTETVGVYGKRPDSSVSSSRRSITPRMSQESAGVISTDVLRVVQLVPGAAAANDDFSNRYVVRGGDPEENTVLLENLPLFRTGHMDGLTAVLCDELIGNVEVYPGALPARFGDALSSVTTLEFIRPQRKGGFARYDLASLGAGGMLAGERASIVAGARVSLIDPYLNRPAGVRGRGFRDASGRASLPFGPLDGVLVLALSQDEASGQFGRSSSAHTAGFTLGWDRGGTLGRLGVSSARSNRFVRTSSVSMSRADLDRLAVTGEGRWVQGSRLQLRTNGELRTDHFFDGQIRRSASGGSLAAEGTFEACSSAVAAGGRLERIPFTRGTWFSPYLSARIRAMSRLTAGAAWRVARQSPFPLSDDAVVAGLPVDAAVLLAAGDGTLSPLQATHLSGSLAVEAWTGASALVEIYDKRYERLVTWRDPSGPTSTTVGSEGTGRGRGVVFTVKREAAGQVGGVLSYTVSRTRKREGPAAAQAPGDFDRPRMVQVAIDIPLGGGTRLALAARYAPGRPYTPLASNPSGDLVPGAVNSARLPYYRRIDVKLDHRVVLRNFDVFFYIDVLNLTGNENIDEISQTATQAGSINRLIEGSMPITPIAGLSVRF